MDNSQKQAAYLQVKIHFDLKASQRDKLDACADLDQILYEAYDANWDTVERLLNRHGIIETQMMEQGSNPTIVKYTEKLQELLLFHGITDLEVKGQFKKLLIDAMSESYDAGYEDCDTQN